MTKKYINNYWCSSQFYTFYEFKKQYEAGVKEKNARNDHSYKSCLEILPQIIYNTNMKPKKPHLFKDKFSNKKLYYEPAKFYPVGWFCDDKSMDQYYINLKKFHDDMPPGIKRLLNESKIKLEKLKKARTHIKDKKSKNKYDKKISRLSQIIRTILKHEPHFIIGG